MQTFLPYSNFKESAKCLDYRRLGKQRVEAMQIYTCLTGGKTKSGKSYTGWKNHPAVKMWRGYESALAHYHNIMIEEWKSRGYNNTMSELPVENLVFPPWLGNSEFHLSHRSNLLRKDKEYYSKFNWNIPENLEYIWPGE